MESIVIGLVVLAWLLWRQLQVRELRHDRGYVFPLAICVVGAVQIAAYNHEHRLSDGAIALLVLSIVVAAAFSIWRATTVRVWLHDGRLLRQGTAVTIVLWLVAIAIHVGGDHLIAPTTPTASAASRCCSTSGSAWGCSASPSASARGACSPAAPGRTTPRRNPPMLMGRKPDV